LEVDVCLQKRVKSSLSSVKYYKWRSKLGGMDVSLISRLKELQLENKRVDVQLDSEVLKEVLAKK
jgi:putative transposase